MTDDVEKQNSETDAAVNEQDSAIEETKRELAQAYVNFLDKKKGLLSMAANRININPEEEAAMNVILSEPEVVADEEQTGIEQKGEEIKQNAKKIVLEKIDPGKLLQYDQAKLLAMRDLILANKDNKEELDKLIVMIKDEKKDPTEKENVDGTVTPAPTTNTETPTSATTTNVIAGATVLPMFGVYKNLKITENINQEEINYINQNAKTIVESLETKGELSKIGEIKDSNGNIVLKCRGETPYINSKAAADLIGLSLLYYKKTGQNILLESAYRTIAHQARLKKENAAKGTPTADPGYSGHNLGYSIDVSTATRYANKIGGIDGTKKLAKLFNFNPISSEDRHFDHSEFVDNYYKNREARLPIAQKLDKLFSTEQEPLLAAA